MRLFAAVAILAMPALRAQEAGIPTAVTRQLNDVSQMGRHPPRPFSDLHDLTFEESDDPTVGAHAPPPHEPTRAARKAALKGEHFTKKNRHEEAVAQYREAVKLDPLYYEAWNNLALELEAAGQLDEAVATFRRMIQSTPEHVLGFTNLATLLSRQHKFAEAELVARQALKTHAYSFKANYTLAVVLLNEGKWNDEAKIKLEYAQVKYPEAKSLLSKWPAR